MLLGMGNDSALKFRVLANPEKWQTFDVCARQLGTRCQDFLINFEIVVWQKTSTFYLLRIAQFILLHRLSVSSSSPEQHHKCSTFEIFKNSLEMVSVIVTEMIIVVSVCLRRGGMSVPRKSFRVVLCCLLSWRNAPLMRFFRIFRA